MYVVPRVITDLLPQLLRRICITVRHVTSCCAMPCRVLPFPCPSLPISFLVPSQRRVRRADQGAPGAGERRSRVTGSSLTRRVSL